MTVEITIPRPPSVNSTRRYDWANHDKYKAWRVEAGLRLNRQNPDHVTGPVRLEIAIEDTGRGDLDNCAKGAIDLLVGHGIIEQDNRRIVREIRMTWDTSVTGCRVRVERIVEKVL